MQITPNMFTSKWIILTGIALWLTCICLADEITIFKKGNKAGKRFKQFSAGEHGSIDNVLKKMLNLKGGYTFELKSEMPYQDSSNEPKILKKYITFYNGWRIDEDVLTLSTFENGTYTGDISGTIVADMHLENIGPPNPKKGSLSLIENAMEAVSEAVGLMVNDDEDVIFDAYIQCINDGKYASSSDKAAGGEFKDSSGKSADSKGKSAIRTYKSFNSGKRRQPKPAKSRVFDGTTKIMAPSKQWNKCTSTYMYSVSFLTNDETGKLVKPRVEFAIASTKPLSVTPVEIYDDIQSYNMNGYGGNTKTGRYEFGSGRYSGLPLKVTTTDNVTCELKNEHVQVISEKIDPTKVASGPCNPGTSLDKDDESYGQAHDALAFGSAVYMMLDEWYSDTALVDGCPVMKMTTHYDGNYDNAFYEGQCSTKFGGGSFFYPLAVNDVVAHEFGHAYTDKTSGLWYSYDQSGSINEAFSDMMGQTTEVYIDNTNDWELGEDMMRGSTALRYFIDPPQDTRSIDCAHDFDRHDMHLGSGVFNKAFYLLSTKPNWSIRKAFPLFLHSNHFFWGSTDGYYLAAEKVWTVAKANTVPGYEFSTQDADDVADAFKQVGVEVDCPSGFWLASLSSITYTTTDIRTACIKIVTDDVFFDETTCAEYGGNLLTVDTERETGDVVAILDQYAEQGNHDASSEYWAGKTQTGTADCEYVAIRNTKVQTSREGIYYKQPSANDCNGRPSYKQEDGENFISFINFAWIVGEEWCENWGSIAVLDTALNPGENTAEWMEYISGEWTTAPDLEVVCTESCSAIRRTCSGETCTGWEQFAASCLSTKQYICELATC